MHDQNQPIGDRKYFMQNLNNSMKELFEEQANAIKMLAKLLVEVIMPLPARIITWLTENNVEITKPEEAIKKLSPIITLEQVGPLLEYIKEVDPTGENEKKIRMFAREHQRKIKEALKEIMKNNKTIIDEMKVLGGFLTNNILPFFSPFMLEIYAQVSTQLVTKKEITDCSGKYLLESLSPKRITEIKKT
eukprot:TRINITY_DN9479_c0_g1_i9.p2 TRINITY_DN9479_c0_g1~~TRINITY_DN9479_c0_g1_i9.p2  ORF type:complete len:190 (-),score=53.18 TRINITY_DN9479_c0_g1_i9:147-716(-)